MSCYNVTMLGWTAEGHLANVPSWKNVTNLVVLRGTSGVEFTDEDGKHTIAIGPLYACVSDVADIPL